MAFNVKFMKKKKTTRLAPQNPDGQEEQQNGIDTCPENPYHGGCVPEPCPWGMNFKKSNVVATQSWVWHMLKKVWNWTKFFGTQ